MPRFHGTIGKTPGLLVIQRGPIWSGSVKTTTRLVEVSRSSTNRPKNVPTGVKRRKRQKQPEPRVWEGGTRCLVLGPSDKLAVPARESRVMDNLSCPQPCTSSLRYSDTQTAISLPRTDVLSTMIHQFSCKVAILSEKEARNEVKRENKRHRIRHCLRVSFRLKWLSRVERCQAEIIQALVGLSETKELDSVSPTFDLENPRHQRNSAPFRKKLGLTDYYWISMAS